MHYCFTSGKQYDREVTVKPLIHFCHEPAVERSRLVEIGQLQLQGWSRGATGMERIKGTTEPPTAKAPIWPWQMEWPGLSAGRRLSLVALSVVTADRAE